MYISIAPWAAQKIMAEVVTKSKVLGLSLDKVRTKVRYRQDSVTVIK